MVQSSADAPIKAYWQPGCTSCLRMKEFLTRHGVAFISVNVLEDNGGMAELAELGIRSVPIVRRGADWANGQVLRDVARVAGIRWGDTRVLPPAELLVRLTAIQSAAQRYLRQIPEDRLGEMLPNRPRSYGQLVYHIFNIADAFLEHEVDGRPLLEGAYGRVQAPGTSKSQLAAYGQDVLERLGGWWDEAGPSTDYEAKARVYYGNVNLHEYLERTAWHSGQHVRQLMMVLGKLGIAPDEPLGAEAFAGLPMPDKIWDDEKPVA